MGGNKSIVYIRFDIICTFRHPLGVLESIPCRYGGTTVLLKMECGL